MGSSPHTRDKWKDLLGDCLSDGITPAYAGQIVKTKEFEAFPRDHPRIRGTNTFVLAYGGELNRGDDSKYRKLYKVFSIA